MLRYRLAASFSTVADAAKKKAAAPAPKDAAYEWNVKNVPPMQMPMQASTAAAKPAKVAKKGKKGGKKKAKA